jgi:hypothetical protein
MKSMVDLSISRNVMRPAMTDDAAERDTHAQSASQAEVESWARRAMWLLVAVTSMWDIAVTFDRHFELTARLF